MQLRQHALDILCIADPAAKAAAARQLQHAFSADRRPLTNQEGRDEVLHPALSLPGRPPRPRLVPAKDVPMRSAFTPAGRAALLHAVAHIEFNAINLALDALWRFPGLPEAYYRDWLQVAAEEALHFTLLTNHLATLNCRYGDHDAHDGLWAMVERTASDPTARMALVPRTLEARGLDATPPMQAKLARAGDHAAVAILDVILRDEIGHVAIGNRWYHWLCQQSGLDPVAHFAVLAERHLAPRPRPPFNTAARLAAGFTPDEISALSGG